MVLSLQEKINFLQQRPVFKSFTSSDLEAVAQRLEVRHLNPGGTVYQQGIQPEHLFMIYSGNIALTCSQTNIRSPYATLHPGQLFGMEALIFGSPPLETSVALEKSVLLTMSRFDFDWLLTEFPDTLISMRALSKSYRLLRRQRFDWLQQDEAISYLTQRNLFGLSKDLVSPLVLLLCAVVIGIAGFMDFAASSILLFTIAGFLALISAGSITWKIFDWRQDHFIITNLRIVQLEGMLLFGCTQKEIPLNQIQFIHTRSDRLGNLFHYGDILIRTFTNIGNTTLSFVNYPEFFKEIVFEQCDIEEQNSRATRNQNYRQSIQQAIGLDTHINPRQQGRSLAATPLHPQSGWSFPKKRVDTGDQTTYYKHWIVLINKILFPLVVLFGMLLINLTAMLNQVDIVMDFRFPSLCSAQLLLALGCGLFIWYQYSDYKNDLYQLTNDLIIDRDKKPLFGRMEIKTAPLKNVQSTWIDRSGVLRHILNYGTVYINVADQTLQFLHVYDPNLVQQDIFTRLNQLHQLEKENSAAAEVSRMTDMIRTYHELHQGPNDPDIPIHKTD